MTDRRLTAAAGLILAVTLPLTACSGSGEDDRPDAKQKPPTASMPTADKAVNRQKPEFDFPRDLTVKVDADTTGNPVKDRILRDHGRALRALLLARAELDPGLPVLKRYVGGDSYFLTVRRLKDAEADGRSITGVTRFYNRKVTLRDRSRASVSYCEDPRLTYEKDAESGEVHRSRPSTRRLVRHSALMEKSRSGVWQLTFDQAQRGAPECRR